MHTRSRIDLLEEITVERSANVIYFAAKVQILPTSTEFIAEQPEKIKEIETNSLSNTKF